MVLTLLLNGNYFLESGGSHRPTRTLMIKRILDRYSKLCTTACPETAKAEIE
jgi:hypothetical protein